MNSCLFILFVRLCLNCGGQRYKELMKTLHLFLSFSSFLFPLSTFHLIRMGVQFVVKVLTDVVSVYAHLI